MDLEALLKAALEAEQKGSTKKGLSGEDALDLEETLRKISAIDLGKVKAEQREELSPIERMVEDLKDNKKVTRALRVTKKERKKVHWSRKRAAKRKYDRTRYKEVLRPKRNAKLAEELLTPEGWWGRMNETWKLNGVEVEMTYAEFEEVVYPAFYPNVPVVIRYDKTLPIRLDNVLLRDTDTREVLFCGKEWLLKKLGYVL